MGCEMRKQQDLYQGIICICIANAFHSHWTFNIQLFTEHLLCARCWGYNGIHERQCSCLHGAYTSVGKWTVIKKTNKVISDSAVCYEDSAEDRAACCSKGGVT